MWWLCYWRLCWFAWWIWRCLRRFSIFRSPKSFNLWMMPLLQTPDVPFSGRWSRKRDVFFSRTSRWLTLALPSVANATGAHFRAKKIYSKFKTMFRNLGASNPQPSTVLRDALTATPALFMFRSVFWSIEAHLEDQKNECTLYIAERWSKEDDSTKSILEMGGLVR